MRKFTTSTLRRFLGGSTYRKGSDYFARGKVLSYEYETADRIVGKVIGTRPNPYSVEVDMRFGVNGKLVWFRGDCTCPMRLNCKHVAATMIAAQDSLASSTGAAAKEVPGGIGIWLEKWPGADREAENVGEAELIETSQEHLFYVFGIDSFGRASIESYRAYLKQDGTIGGNSVQYLGVVSSQPPKYMTTADVVILAKLDLCQKLRNLSVRDWPEGEECIELVRSIIDTGRARDRSLKSTKLWWGEARSVRPEWSRDEQGTQHIEWREENGEALQLLPFPVPLYIDPATGESGIAESELSRRLLRWLGSAPPTPAATSAEVARQLAQLEPSIPLPKAMQIEERTSVRPQPLLKLYSHTTEFTGYRYGRYARGVAEAEVRIYPCVRLEVLYDGVAESMPVNESRKIEVHEQDRITIIHRDQGRETKLKQALEDAAVPYGGGGVRQVYHHHSMPKAIKAATILLQPILREADAATQRGSQFTLEVLPRLRAEGWQIQIEDSWPFHMYEGPIGFSTSAAPSEADWFSFSFNLEADGQTVDLTDILVGLIEAMPLDDPGAFEDGFDVLEFLEGTDVYGRLDDGRRVVFDGTRLAPFVEAFLELQGLIGFHRAEAGRVWEMVEALEGSGAPWRGGRELLHLGERLRMLSSIKEIPLPASLLAELRPYQRVGYAWLRAVYDSGFGGVLADDMGLGKTVQTLALLADRHLEEGVARPSLVIVPTSLIGTWKREAARFTPKLKLLVLHGPERRQKFSEIAEHHLVITTYPLVNRDHESLFAHEYEVAVLDEAQWVKNPAAAVSKRIREIRARQRIALTGTPLENNLLELWSLFDWLIPGLLGDRKAFTSDYRTPIEKHGDADRQRLLSTRIKPFLLRRTKEQVAKDLPKKTVIEELVPLEGNQAALYESIRSAMDERVRRAITEKGLAASSITILDALLKLRQVCCDPALVKLDAARKVKESAKRARMLAVLEELVSEGRRILVFSQFVSMLKLIETDIASKGWSYAMLHGGTRHRDDEIERFQCGEVSIFLISLKAGGTGLNLTAADTVMLYDPWWNPAVERQAMDRTHRIGQDKPVFVYRLIAENTVESVIAEMQVRKQALADALFEGTGEGPLALTKEDVDALFVAGSGE